LKAKETGSLSSTKRESNLSQSLQQVELSSSADGKLRFGDKILLWNFVTEGVLASDISEKLGQFDESFSVSSARGLHPSLRSVFTVRKYEKESDYFTDDILHYGQKFRLQAESGLYKKDLFLTSLAANPMRCAKFTRFNEVSVSHKDNIDTVWSLDYFDPKQRFEQQRQEVLIADPVLIRHVLTSQWLASDIVNYPNQFGTEFEVFGHSEQSHNKTQVLGAEKGGKTTIDIPCRNNHNKNHWQIITANNSSEKK